MVSPMNPNGPGYFQPPSKKQPDLPGLPPPKKNPDQQKSDTAYKNFTDSGVTSTQKNLADKYMADKYNTGVSKATTQADKQAFLSSGISSDQKAKFDSYKRAHQKANPVPPHSSGNNGTTDVTGTNLSVHAQYQCKKEDRLSRMCKLEKKTLQLQNLYFDSDIQLKVVFI